MNSQYYNFFNSESAFLLKTKLASLKADDPDASTDDQPYGK